MKRNSTGVGRFVFPPLAVYFFAVSKNTHSLSPPLTPPPPSLTTRRRRTSSSSPTLAAVCLAANGPPSGSMASAKGDTTTMGTD